VLIKYLGKKEDEHRKRRQAERLLKNGEKGTCPRSDSRRDMRDLLAVGFGGERLSKESASDTFEGGKSRVALDCTRVGKKVKRDVQSKQISCKPLVGNPGRTGLNSAQKRFRRAVIP